MPTSSAYIATERAPRYIEQLMANMASAELSRDGRGTIRFNRGACVLTPFGRGLTITITAEDAETVAGVQETITDQLTGFAVSGEKLSVDWAGPRPGDSLDLVDPVLGDYLLDHCTPADGLLKELAIKTREATGPRSGMQVSHDEGAFLTMLVKMSGARRAIEVGVFTGYSSICIARGLPEDGRLLALDINEEWTGIAKHYWGRAGVADRIELRIGAALDSLRALPADPAFDFAFIDADKVSYPAYYDEIIERVLPGGLVVLDNVFLGGEVLDPAFQDEDSLAMRGLNDRIVGDDRVESVMLPVRDGVTVVRKR